MLDISQAPKESIIIVKPSHRLHDTNVSTTIGFAMEKRLSNMVSALYRELYWTNRKKNQLMISMLGSI